MKTPEGMTRAEHNLLEILKKVNAIEIQCQRLDTITAVPVEVYQLVGKLRDKISAWGIACVVEENHKEKR